MIPILCRCVCKFFFHETLLYVALILLIILHLIFGFESALFFVIALATDYAPTICWGQSNLCIRMRRLSVEKFPWSKRLLTRKSSLRPFTSEFILDLRDYTRCDSPKNCVFFLSLGNVTRILHGAWPKSKLISSMQENNQNFNSSKEPER